MERTTFGLLFYIRRTKLNKSGEASIFLRITVNGERAGGFTLGAGRFSGKLPGRIIEAKQLPDPVRRFVLQHFPSLNRFSYRWDKRFYYAVNENGGYLLLSADGMLGGFRYHVRQIPREFVDLLPGTSMTYLRERYPNHFLCAFLPQDKGYRAELFGVDDRIVYFDSEGRFVKEE